MEVSSNSQIAKNAIFLYVRMLLSLIVSLYTSRVVLDVLGVSDYGIYSIVGGVVLMFSFLNASMSSATSRFMAFEIGKGDINRINKTFSNSLAVHLIITLVVAVLLETVGLWILMDKLVIDENRIFAAQVVYQFSVLSTLVGITQIPYNAAIIAHEKMNVYAYVELANVFLKLGIVYLLSIGNFDKLILYGFLMFTVTILIMMIYRLYCWRHFEECKQRPSMEKEFFKPMISFAAWGLYGDGCYSLRQQGTNILLNMFFGTIVNAANGIASTVLGVISGFTLNILTAFRPQIVKSYACGNIQRMEQLIVYATKYSLLLIGGLSIILCYEMDYILTLWLKDVPEYTPWICRIILISFCVVTCSFVINAGIQASGSIKLQSFIVGSISLFCILPCTYAFLKFGYSPYSSYVCYGVFTIVMYVCSLVILKRQVREIVIINIIKSGMIPIVSVLAISAFLCYGLSMFIEESFTRVIIITLSTIIISMLLIYSFAMNIEEKEVVQRCLKKLFLRLTHKDIRE